MAADRLVAEGRRAALTQRAESLSPPQYHRCMQIATGTVTDGKIVVEGVPLREGSLVAVLARGADEPFSLSTQQEDELLAAMAEIERGEFISLEELLAELPK